MRTSNPALNDDVFETGDYPANSSAVMTLNGTVGKTAILLLILLVAAAFSWSKAMTVMGSPTADGMSWIKSVSWGASIAGLIVAIITIFRPRYAPYTAPLYAALEGVLLGVVSAMFENVYSGIVLQAVSLTVGVLMALLFAYTSRLIQASENFKLGVVAATGSIFLVYLATMILSLFGIQIPYIHDSGWIGIGFSLFVVVVAALNLVLDFDFIEQGAANGAPKHMEWYGAFGLLVTLIWLYLEILRLLGKLRSQK